MQRFSSQCNFFFTTERLRSEEPAKKRPLSKGSLPKGREQRDLAPRSGESRAFSPFANLYDNPEALKNALFKIPERAKVPSCRKTLDAYFEGSKSLVLGHYLDVGECLLLARDYEGSAKVYGYFLPALRLLSESKLKSRVDFESQTDLFYGFLESHLGAGDARSAEELVRGRCPQWEYSHACVGKLLVYAHQKVSLDRDGEKLFDSLGLLPPAAQSRLFFAGAMLASQGGRLRIAEQRVKMALETLPERAQATRRSVLEYWSSELFHRGTFTTLRSFSEKALSQLRSSLHGGLVKLRFFRDLTSSPDRKKVLRGYLFSTEARDGVLRDLDLLDVLGAQALRLRMVDEWEQFLRAAATTVRDSKSRMTNAHKSSAFRKNINFWFARIAVARGEYLSAIKILSTSDVQLETDPIAHHLRGVAYFLMAESSGNQLQAISELGKAYRLKRSWESLAALGFSLIKTGKNDLVLAVMKDLDGLVATPGQKYWADLLKGEYYFTQGKHSQAEKIAQDLIDRDPDVVLPRLLLLRVLSKMRRFEDVKKEQGRLEVLTRQKPYAGSFEALASPFGPLSLGRRPID